MAMNARTLRTAALNLAVAAAVLCAAGVTGTAGRSTADFSGYARTDTVDIELEACAPADAVLAEGERIEIPVRITNSGSPCWLRLRASAEEDAAELACALLHDGSWVAAPDGWLYRTAPLEEGEVLEMAELVSVAEKTSHQERIDVRTCVRADAIQRDGFNPDFNEADPWHGIAPQACERTRQGGLG